MIYLAFTLGLFIGAVLVFVWLSVMAKNANVAYQKQVLQLQQDSLDALNERNRISREQLEVMKGGAA